jgi:hypothetical protein
MELEELKEEVFAQHLNTKFYIQFDDARVELELVKVIGDKSSLESVKGVERFSLYFWGSGDFCLSQRIYRMEHDTLGTLDIFIVPIGLKDERYQYEAVFGHMTE